MLDTQTLFERIGGKAALATVVDEFYRRVVGDKLLAPFFEGTDMARQRGHQAAFLTQALGGPANYSGKVMSAAHAGRGIQKQHFGAVAGHLAATLRWAGVSEPELGTIMATAAGLEDSIVEP